MAKIDEELLVAILKVGDLTQNELSTVFNVSPTAISHKLKKLNIKLERHERIVVCSCCGQEKKYYARGLCSSCYRKLKEKEYTILYGGRRESGVIGALENIVELGYSDEFLMLYFSKKE